MSAAVVVDVRRGFGGWIAECSVCGDHAERRHPRTASKWASDHAELERGQECPFCGRRSGRHTRDCRAATT